MTAHNNTLIRVADGMLRPPSLASVARIFFPGGVRVSPLALHTACTSLPNGTGSSGASFMNIGLVAWWAFHSLHGKAAIGVVPHDVQPICTPDSDKTVASVIAMSVPVRGDPGMQSFNL